MNFLKLIQHKDKVLILIVILVALTGLLGWYTGDISLAQVSKFYIPIAPSTAYSFLILSLALMLLKKNNNKYFITLSLSMLSILILFSSTVILSNLFNIFGELENIFVKNPTNFGDVKTGRMSPLTAFLFIIESIVVVMLYLKTKSLRLKFHWVFILTSFFSSSILLIGYLYNEPLLYGVGIIPVALPTAICFWLLSVALIIIVHYKYAPLTIFTKDSTEVKLAKAFIPAFVILIIIYGYMDSRVISIYNNHILNSAILLVVTVPVVILIILALSRTIGKSLETANQQVKESKERFDLAMEASKDGIFDWNLITNEIYYSPSWKKMLGYNDNELPNDFSIWENLTEPEDAKRSWEMQQKVISKELDRFELEFKMKHKDGSWVDILSRAEAVFDENGKAVRIVGTHVDVTQRKVSEQLLKESEKRYEALHNASFGGITIHDKGIILECNNGLSEISGYSYNELIGMNGLLLIAEESREDVSAKIKSAYEEPYEVIGLRKNDEKYPLQLEARNVPYKGNEVRAVEFRDITLQKEAEQNLIKALEKATESDRLKSTFLATMSHELRTPLNAIIGFSDLIDEDTPNKDAVQYSKTVNASGNHLLNIVEDLFDITLIEAGQIKIENQTIDLLHVLDEVKKIIENEQKNLEKIHIDFSLKIPANIEKIGLSTDESKFKQLLINLLKNALKFTHEGHVHFGFELETKKSRLKFYVEDTGIGIPEDKQELIFNAFRRVEETYTKTYGGTGIGLSLSKKIAKILGGEIWVESELGKGSTFFFTVPYGGIEDDKNSNKSKPKDSEKQKKNYTDKLILIAEDDKSSYEYLVAVLKKSTGKILLAENGEIAVQTCKENPAIDLVLMDVNMPVMNGYEATKAIKKFRPNLPIIAQTAYAISGDMEKAIENGCDDYISKPIKKEELFMLLKKYM